MAKAKEITETFSGKAKDQTFETFDEKVLTWCRKKFGDRVATNTSTEWKSFSGNTSE